MSEIFFVTLTSNTLALVQVLLIALAGAILVRTQVFKSGDVKGLTLIIINVLLPAMIFSNIVGTLDPQRFPLWWLLPLAGVGTRSLKIWPSFADTIRVFGVKFLIIPVVTIAMMTHVNRSVPNSLVS